MNYRDLATTITTRLVAQIEAGAGQWRMPWHTTPGFLDARNAATGQRYRGANTLILAFAALDDDYPTGYWATYRQWSALGAHVQRGERATRIIKWVPRRNTNNDSADASADDERTDDARLVPKVYAVFNAAQVDNWNPPETTTRSPIERHDRVDAWIAATGADIEHGHNHARYYLKADRIEVPAPEHFCDAAAYYSTVAHELIHWSGHPTRLARDLTGRFGDDAYAAEELIAELGAAIACAQLDITPSPRDDHAAYLAHWLSILNADPTALFAVAGKAQTAVDHLNTYSDHVTDPA